MKEKRRGGAGEEDEEDYKNREISRKRTPQMNGNTRNAC